MPSVDTPVHEDHADLDARLDTQAEPLHEEGVVVFSSKHRLLRLVRVPARDRMTDFGKERLPNLVYEFSGGYLQVDDGLHKRDEAIFADVRDRIGEAKFAQLDTRPAEEWLRDHHMFDQPSHGFVEVSHTPAPEQALAKIAELSAEGDLEALAELYTEEERTHKRPVILDTALKAARTLDAKREQEDPPPKAA